MAWTYVLAKYVEDDVLYMCTDKKVRDIEEEQLLKLVQYSDKQWYQARILGRGNKSEMLHLKRQMEKSPGLSTRRVLKRNCELTVSRTLPECEDEVNFIPSIPCLSPSVLSSPARSNGIVVSSPSNIIEDLKMPERKEGVDYIPSIPCLSPSVLSSPARGSGIAVSSPSKVIEDLKTPLSTPRRYSCRILNISRSPAAVLPPKRRLFVPSEDYDDTSKSSSESSVCSFNGEQELGPQVAVIVDSTESFSEIAASVSSNSRDLFSEETVLQQIQAQPILSDEEVQSSVPKMVLPKKKRDKRQCCLFCGNLVIQLSRHLLQKHRNEEMVSKMSRLPAGDSERLKIIADLRKRGNFKHNCGVLRSGNGDVIVRRRPSSYPRVVDDFVPCPTCFVWLSRKFLYKHTNSCGKTKKEKWTRVQGSAMNLLPILPQASTALKEKVLSRMNQDNIFKIIRNDWLILQFGSSLCQRHIDMAEQHLAIYIATKMRELARLLEEICNKSDLHQLADAICPAHFDLIVDCTKTVAGFDENTGRFATPSLALKLGFSLVKCANLLLQQAIVSSADNVRKKVQDFLVLYDVKWKASISRHSYTTLKVMRYNKPSLIPVAKDIKLLNDFLNKQETTLSERLSVKYDYVTFSTLSKVILSKLILFNRKRSGASLLCGT